jgi:hypothetical protein
VAAPGGSFDVSGPYLALSPRLRADAGTVRRHPELFKEAAACRLEA